MKVAVVSDDFRSVSGHARDARRFLIFEVTPGQRPELERYFELPSNAPDYAALRDDDRAFHPIDGMILIVAELDAETEEQLGRRETTAHRTDELDPLTAVMEWSASNPPFAGHLRPVGRWVRTRL